MTMGNSITFHANKHMTFPVFEEVENFKSFFILLTKKTVQGKFSSIIYSAYFDFEIISWAAIVCSFEIIVKRRLISLVQDDFVCNRTICCVDINKINEHVTGLVEELLIERLTNWVEEVPIERMVIYLVEELLFENVS